MVQSVKTAADAVLNKAVNSTPGVPGVVAVATDRNANIYEGAFGVRQAGADAAMTTDSVFAIFSTTKAITGTACLQLVEDGKLDLDAPAKTYAPEIGKLQVIDGFDDAGKPKLRAPKRDITTRMLLLHTAGFGYDFFNENYNRLAQNHGSERHHRVACFDSDPAAVRSRRKMGVRLKHGLGRPSGRGHSRQAAWRSHEGADLQAAGHGGHRILDE